MRHLVQSLAVLLVFAGCTTNQVIIQSPVNPPEPVATRAMVGCYYRLGEKDFRGDSWQEVLVTEPQPRPLLGMYRDGDPGVLDWQIRWARESGVSFFAVDWLPGQDEALAAFDAERFDRSFQYCLNWRNDMSGEEIGERGWQESLLRRMQPAMAQRFGEEGYLKIAGDPVLIIEDPLALIRASSRNEVRDLLHGTKNQARGLGFRGLFVIGTCPSDGRDIVLTMEDLGFDAITDGVPLHPIGRAFDPDSQAVPYKDMVERSHRLNIFYSEIGRNRSIHYFPMVAPGWDARPFAGPDSRVETDSDADKFEEMCWSAMRNTDQTLPVVLVSSWNDFLRGDFVEPDRQHGFIRLDTLRKVFVRDGDESVEYGRPSSRFVRRVSALSSQEQQEARDNYRRIRPRPSVLNVESASGVAAEGAASEWRFSGASDLSDGWSVEGGSLALADEGLVVTARGDDLQVTTPLMDVPVANLRAITLEFQVEGSDENLCDYGVGRLAWRTTRHGNFTEYDSTAFGYTERGGWQRVLLVPSTFRAWEEARGVLVQARLEFTGMEKKRLVLRRVAFEE